MWWPSTRRSLSAASRSGWWRDDQGRSRDGRDGGVMTMTSVIIIVGIALLLGVYISWRAGRLDRLHARLEAARAALDVALLRRSSAALELASTGLLDPATSLLLAGAAHDARIAADDAKELRESDLTRALRAAFGQPEFRASLAGGHGADELLAEVEAAGHRGVPARKL